MCVRIPLSCLLALLFGAGNPNIAQGNRADCADVKYEIEGVILDGETKTPIEGALVVVDTGIAPAGFQTVSDSSGRYSGTLVVWPTQRGGRCEQPGKLIVFAKAAGYGYFERTVKLRETTVDQTDAASRLEARPILLRRWDPERGAARERVVTVRCDDLPRHAYVNWTDARSNYERQVVKKRRSRGKHFDDRSLLNAVVQYFEKVRRGDIDGALATCEKTKPEILEYHLTGMPRGLHCYNIDSAQLYMGTEYIGVWTKVVWLAGEDPFFITEGVVFDIWFPAESGWKIKCGFGD